MISNKELKSWINQISAAQDRYKFELTIVQGDYADVDLWMSGEYVKTIPLFTDEIESIENLVDRLLTQTNAHRNFRYELKKKLAGLEKVTFWTGEEQAHVLREIAGALRAYPELTCAMLRCIKTGHNISLAKVDSKMEERKNKGFYD
ncbi:hypothetical protein NVP1254O_33 [Vibrio phage 1.254.O._10N.286.45.C8]|nr:hypothetical protein NVP1254O_33 [Vibrio phage 1.254.O._10N.286.45.C8]